MKFTSHYRTDVGRVRELNEDSVTIVRPRHEKLLKARGELLVVADGMGGHESGEIASGQAVETIKKSYYDTPGDPADALRKAIEEANRTVYQRAKDENRHGMGTTVVAAAHIEGKLYIAHVGDSRLYLIRGAKIHLLTRDHSLVAEQVAAGILTPEEAEIHPHRNVVSRAVGTSPQVEVEIAASSPLTLQQGDTILICSDGLTEHVRPEEILRIAQGKPPEEATDALVDAANAAGGTDNISIIVAQAGDVPAAPVDGAAPATAPGSEDDTSPMAAVQEEAKPEPKPAKPAGGGSKGPIVAATIGLLALLFLGGAGIWSWAAIVSVPEPTMTVTPVNQFQMLVTPSPEGTPSVEESPSPAAGSGSYSGEEASDETENLENSDEPAETSPEVTPTRTPRASPTSPPTRTPPTSIGEQEDGYGNVTIRLLEPEPDREVKGQAVTFRATISNLQQGDQPQLRMGRTPEAMTSTHIPLLRSGEVWEVELQQPPGGLYGDWYWTVAIVTDEVAEDGGTLVFRADPPRHLIWNRQDAQFRPSNESSS